MNGEQLKGIVERLLYVLLPLIAVWIPFLADVKTQAMIVSVILGIAGVFLGWKQNTPESLSVAAAKEGDIKKMETTNPEVAKAVNDAPTPTSAKVV